MNTDEAKRLGERIVASVAYASDPAQLRADVARLVAMVQGVEKERVLLADAGRVIRNLVMPDHPVLRAIETALAQPPAEQAPDVSAAGEPVAWANNDVPPMLFWDKTEALKHTSSEADLVPLYTKDQ